MHGYARPMDQPRPPGRQTLALASLVGMAMLWGSTFFSIKALVTHIPVADMLGVRFTIAAVVIGLAARRNWRMPASTLRRGALLGLVYGTAQLVQTYGLARTSASMSGFITGMYVVFTPLLAARLLRERVAGSTWLAVLLAAAGLGVLSLRAGDAHGPGLGELLTLACAGLYAVHIVLVDRFAADTDAMSLTNVQTLVCAAMTLLAALPGSLSLPHGGAQWSWMLYLAVLAGAVPIFLQIWAQSRVESTTAAVIMSGEPVWAAVFAVLFGGEHPTWQMVLGGAAMVAAMLIVTLTPSPTREAADARHATGMGAGSGDGAALD